MGSKATSLLCTLLASNEAQILVCCSRMHTDAYNIAMSSNDVLRACLFRDPLSPCVDPGSFY